MIKTKRILKRNKLIKDLFDNYKKIICYNDAKIPCKIRISNNSHIGGRFYITYNPYTNNLKGSININPYIIRKIRIKKGYGINSYYKNRGEKIDKYILGNYKKALRFVILHEFGHLNYYNKYGRKGSKKSLVRKELYADNFALRYLNKDIKSWKTI